MASRQRSVVPVLHAAGAARVRYDTRMTPKYTTAEAGALLGLRPSAIRSAIRRGRMIAERHGRDYFVTLAEIRAYEMTSLGQVGRPPKNRKIQQGVGRAEI